MKDTVSNIIRSSLLLLFTQYCEVILQGKMTGTEHVTRVRKCIRNFDQEILKQKSLGRPRQRWENIILVQLQLS
jgi:hypothetical protein